MATVQLEATRRKVGVRALALLGTALLLLAVAVVSVWSFITPSGSHEQRLGPAAAFAPGTVSSFVREGDGLAPFLRPSPNPAWGWPAGFPLPAGELVHVVRFPDGEIVVFSGVSPHRGQGVIWFPDAVSELGAARGLFGDDFSWWTVDGTRHFGPTPRDLPRYSHRVDESGALIVDLEQAILGTDRRGIRPGDSIASAGLPPPYDFLDPGWPTSGWPSR